jgi:hypothetical protein
MSQKKDFIPEFNFKALIIAICIAFPFLFVGNPTFGGIIFGGTLGYLIRKYYKEKKLKRKIKFFEYFFG